MNQENNILNSVLPSFSFSIKEYLQIFNINSLLTLNNFINTRLNSTNKISPTTAYRIFIYGMYEYQKNIINSPDLTLNIITKVVEFINKKNATKDKINKIYKTILSAKDLDDFNNINDLLD
jgi:Glu-tRNA(Gln) amidotransferase subunit E-like FAD-binding protein